MFLMLVQLLALQPKSSLAHQPVMALSNEDKSESAATSGHDGQSRQLEEEPPYPYSFLDGNSNEIAEEEYERLSAL